VCFFQCTPLQALWERYDPVNPMLASDYSCDVDVNKFYLGISVPNIITDVFLILLPIPYIWRLQLRFAQKITIICIFAGGIL